MQKKFKLGPLQKKWVRVLKSGKYKKGQGCLNNDKTNGYCCLGVANDCLSLGTPETGSYLQDDSYRKLGLISGCGSLSSHYKFPNGRNKYYSLAEMNDQGITHVKIAQFIEENPELVFTKSL